MLSSLNYQTNTIPLRVVVLRNTEAKPVDYEIKQIFENGVIIDCYQEDGE